MKKILLSLALILSIVTMQAQIAFEKSFGGPGTDAGVASLQLADGSFITAANTSSFGAGGADVYLIKTNPHGDTLWAKTYGGAGNDFASAIRPTTDGGFIIAGYSNSFGSGDDDVYVIKTDVDGNAIWFKTYGGAGDDEGASVQQTASGYIIAGATKSSGAGEKDVYLLNIDFSGNVNWAKAYGSSADESANAVALTSDGGYFITASSNSFSEGNSDVYLIKTDINGNKVWSKTYGGNGNDYGKAGLQTADGGYIITGSTAGFGAAYSDVYLIRTDGNGDAVFTKSFASAGDGCGNAVKQTADGGFVLTGYAGNTQGNTDACIIRMDEGGNTLWQRNFGDIGMESGNDIVETASGEFMVSGTTTSFGAGNSDVYLIKTDTTGGTSCTQKMCMIMQGSVTSSVAAAADVVTASATATVNNPEIFTGRGCVSATRCYFDNDQLTQGSTDPDLSSIQATHDIADPRSLQTAEVAGSAIVLFPNPSNGQFNFSGVAAGNKIEIFNMSGQLIYTSVCSSDVASVDITGEAKGLYFYRITCGGAFLKSGKVTKE